MSWSSASARTRLCARSRARSTGTAMERALRLTYDADFRRVRTQGRSWAHPFAILCALPNNLPHNRYGFSVSKRLGGAVVRNRVKRLLREAVRTTPKEVGP